MNDSGAVLSVTRLVALLKETVEDNFVHIAVEGEVSNFARPASGHLYFTLKDGTSQIRGVMFRHMARLLKFEPENGLQVVCRGHVSLYQQRGEIQLVAEKMEPVGAGSLQLAFEQLKERLASEGLFDEARKQELPAFPSRVGIVTSATGAAIHDMLRVFRRQGGGLDVVIRPVRVQGEGAASEIAEAIADFRQLPDVDVLIVGRGGGSLEDLWAFNEEVVARAISVSAIPVISAVGHEVDFTISDFVADYRAATPTAAAEKLVQGRVELESHLDHLQIRLAKEVRARLVLLKERLAGWRRRLVSPEQQLRNRRQQLQNLSGRLIRGGQYGLELQSSTLATLAARLDLLSPLKTLDRGYAIVRSENGAVVRRTSEITPGELLEVKFANGGARARVEEITS